MLSALLLLLAAAAVEDVGLEPADPPPSPEPESIYRIAAKPDASIIAGAAFFVVAAYGSSRATIDERCPCRSEDVNRYDRPAIRYSSDLAGYVSEVTVAAAVVVPILLDWNDLGPSRAFVEDFVVFGEALAVNGAMVTASKFVSQRPLPRTYAGDPDYVNEPRGYRSFYSGHTSTAFTALAASAMTARLRYGERYWPWVVVFLAGGSVAVERVAAGYHFPSDVLVGAAMGTATGIAVPWIHARTRVSPLAGVHVRPRGDGAEAGWAIRF